MIWAFISLFLWICILLICLLLVVTLVIGSIQEGLQSLKSRRSTGRTPHPHIAAH